MDSRLAGEICPETGNEIVVKKAQRRQYTAEYKLQIVREADRCQSRGEVGALLRREGLYSSLVSTWRQQLEDGSLKSLSKKRGRKGKSKQELEIEALRKKVRRLQRDLEQAEFVISVQKKASEILGIQLPKFEEEEKD